jgi:hemerythrin-like domain-containing protein
VAAGRLTAGRHLVEVHDHFRQELSQLRELLDQVSSGISGVGEARAHLQTMALRANNWTFGSFCQAYCLGVTQHHSLEDAAVFPNLRTREPGLAAVLDRLGHEHVVIHDLLESVDRALVTLVKDAQGLDPVRTAVDLLAAALLSHFEYEERELVGPLSRLGFY